MQSKRRPATCAEICAPKSDLGHSRRALQETGFQGPEPVPSTMPRPPTLAFIATGMAAGRGGAHRMRYPARRRRPPPTNWGSRRPPCSAAPAAVSTDRRGGQVPSAANTRCTPTPNWRTNWQGRVDERASRTEMEKCMRRPQTHKVGRKERALANAQCQPGARLKSSVHTPQRSPQTKAAGVQREMPEHHAHGACAMVRYEPYCPYHIRNALCRVPVYCRPRCVSYEHHVPAVTTRGAARRPRRPSPMTRGSRRPRCSPAPIRARWRGGACPPRRG